MLTDNKVSIGGFIVTGVAPKPVVLRGMGPSLVRAGVANVLTDPVLELRDVDGALIRRNDNWKDDQRPLIEGTIYQPTDDRESVIVATLQPAAYTTILSGSGGTTGIGLVEIYDDQPTGGSELANLSTRAFVGTGDAVMIGGFILGRGTGTGNVAIRGLGPSLSQFGLNGVVADPTLELRNGNGLLLVSNDNWQDDPAAAAELIAHGLAPQEAHESGIFLTLPPGPVTAILAGRNGGTGIGLVEIYSVH